MAFFALHTAMFPEQWKAAQVMVKLLRGLFPTPLVVAADAVFSEGPFVLVVLGVAGIAIRAQLDPINIAGMACCAGGCGMFSTQ